MLNPNVMVFNVVVMARLSLVGILTSDVNCTKNKGDHLCYSSSQLAYYHYWSLAL